MAGLREQNKQQTKAAILKAALHLFTKKGYENTSIDELTIQTGMPQAELNDYKQWHDDQKTFLFRYNDTVFHFGVWIT